MAILRFATELELVQVQVVGIVGVGVVLVGFLALKLPQDRVGIAVLQLIGVCGIVGAGHNDDLVVCLVGLGVGSVAVNALQVLVGVLVAVSLGIDVHIVIHGLHGGLLFFAEGMTGSLGSIVQSVGVLGTINGGINEIVSPGSAGFLVLHLSAQGSGGVHQVGDPAAVLAGVFLNGVNIEIVQLNGGNLVITNNQGGGHTGSQIGDGSLQGNAGHQSHTQGHDNPEGEGVCFQFLGFFCCGLLLLGHGGSVLLLAELLLAGCTHGKSIPLKICAIGCYANGMTHRPEHYNRFDTEFQVLFLPNQQKS